MTGHYDALGRGPATTTGNVHRKDPASGTRLTSFFCACGVSCRVRAERAKPYASLPLAIHPEDLVRSVSGSPAPRRHPGARRLGIVLSPGGIRLARAVVNARGRSLFTEGGRRTWLLRSSLPGNRIQHRHRPTNSLQKLALPGLRFSDLYCPRARSDLQGRGDDADRHGRVVLRCSSLRLKSSVQNCSRETPQRECFTSVPRTPKFVPIFEATKATTMLQGVYADPPSLYLWAFGGSQGVGRPDYGRIDARVWRMKTEQGQCSS